MYMIIGLCGWKVLLTWLESKEEMAVQPVPCEAALKTVLCVSVSMCEKHVIN